MQMYVYLIHFKYKLHHAGHYIGFSKCLDFRIASHREGTGAKLLRAITRLGIPWIVIRTWRVGGQGFERHLKNQKNAARFCPLCNPKITIFQNEYVDNTKNIQMKTFKYRLRPSKNQRTKLNQTLELCRWIYNETLAARKNVWEQEKKFLSLYDTNKLLTYWK